MERLVAHKLRSAVTSRMRRAYHADSALAAQAELTALAAELDRTHPGAAASLRGGMAETLTVLRLNLPPTLARTFRSTNAVESMIPICRDHSSNVKRWRDGTMALRWCAAGMVEAGKQFRRVNGHMHLRSLRDTLDRVTQLSVPPAMMRTSKPPDDHRAATEVPRNSGHPRLPGWCGRVCLSGDGGHGAGPADGRGAATAAAVRATPVGGQSALHGAGVGGEKRRRHVDALGDVVRHLLAGHRLVLRQACPRRRARQNSRSSRQVTRSSRARRWRRRHSRRTRRTDATQLTAAPTRPGPGCGGGRWA